VIVDEHECNSAKENKHLWCRLAYGPRKDKTQSFPKYQHRPSRSDTPTFSSQHIYYCAPDLTPSRPLVSSITFRLLPLRDRLLRPPLPRHPTYAPTALPPSISKFTPVTNLPSSLPRYKHMFATSMGSVKRPNGTLNRNLLTFSSVNGTPTKLSNNPVPDRRGHSAFTRICSLPNSAARPLVACGERVLAAWLFQS